MNKKGDLSLSITAIVVIVIAFVVLGLGLSLTRTIFKGAQDKLPEAFAVTQLESEPTADNPITIPQTVEIQRTKTKTMSIGFYNTNSNSREDATFYIRECLNDAGDDVNAEFVPTVASVSTLVKGSEAKGFSVILTENGLQSPKTYVCTIEVCKKASCLAGTPEDIYESKQFFLSVIG